MMLSQRRAVALHLIALAALSVARAVALPEQQVEAEQKPRAVRVESWGSLPVKSGFQSLHSNAAGDVFAIAEDGYKVFAIAGSKAVEKAKLPVTELAQRPLRAALAETGRIWVLNGRSGQILLVDGDDVTTLPSPPLIERSFAFLGTTPVAVGEPQPSPNNTEDQTIAAVYSGDEWESFFKNQRKSGDDPNRFTSYIAAGTERGKLWLADEYDYRLRLLSPQGKVQLDLRIPQIHSAKASASEIEALEKLIEQRGVDQSRIERVQAIPESVVRAIASRRSDAYVFWRDSSSDENAGFLDSVDPRGEVRRIQVGIPKARRVVSLAAGKDGLYFAAALAKDGIFRLAWEDLEVAPWRRVGEATFEKGADSD